MRGLLLVLAGAGLAAAPDEPPYERAPIHYSATKPDEAVGRLKAELTWDDAHGWLKSFLAALDVPVSSQMLVFSKTSLQAHRISPTSPRAVYFNDDVYVGWVPGGEVLEVSSVDARLGAVFYTVRQEPTRARIDRQTHACLQCHDSRGHTLGVPGHIVRSVFPAGDGLPRYELGTHKIDYRSPYEERWGGWYVTGRHGSMKHLGNVFFPADPRDHERVIATGQNLEALPPRVDATAYLSPGSDIVALMVLEHQAYVHNLITRANHEARIAALQSEEINRMSGEGGSGLTEGNRSRLRAACDPLVEALFFSGEPPLPSPVQGSGSFAEEFEKRGPFDAKGRSLRQFDLRTRLFRYPLSYLVYSNAFAGLPAVAREYIEGRMRAVLEGRDASRPFAHLSAQDRASIREILGGTGVLSK